jgi:hypothetical protein
VVCELKEVKGFHEFSKVAHSAEDGEVNKMHLYDFKVDKSDKSNDEIEEEAIISLWAP